jgi:MFS transporter, CP family, cyanate transporter
MYVGKLPALLPIMAEEFAITRLQTGWLLAVFQVAGMLLGIAAGLLTDRVGRKRMMVFGLFVSAAASICTPFFVHSSRSDALYLLLGFRAIESIGFLATVLPAPGLLQRLVRPNALKAYMGWWAAYMPIGMALGLMAAPALSESLGWRDVWIMIGILNLLLGLILAYVLPADRVAVDSRQDVGMGVMLGATFGSAEPWLLALLFFFYASQWMTLFGFLPSIYKDQGVSSATSGWLTGLAVLANAIGNVLTGLRVNRFQPWQIVFVASAAMMVCSAIALGAVEQVFQIQIGFNLRYVAVLLFSAFAGFIPGTIFGLIGRCAPVLPNGEKAIGTTMGMVQQGSASGQVLLPICAAWIVELTGVWANTSWLMFAMTCGCCLVAIGLRKLLH